MKNSQISLFLLTAITLLQAVPANPEPGIVRYPDGRTLKVYLRGDENLSWHESADGKVLLRNVAGIFEYALQDKQGKLTASGIKAHDPAYRDLHEETVIATIPYPHLEPGKLKGAMPKNSGNAPAALPFGQTDFPTLGEQKFLLILVEFSDKSFIHRPEDFDSLMNGNSYSYNGAVGSVSRYYQDGSFDLFKPQFDIAGPVVLDSGWAFYGKGDDENIQRFVYEAVTKADPMVDYSQYDNDNDGFVDNIYFIYAGYGECFYGADENTIWPHRWVYFASNLVVDGKRVYDYSTSMELYGISGTTRTSIGVIAHEFGHVCGLPDYYDTDYEGSGGNCGGLGNWDLMAGGSWNDSGKRPPLFNAWSRAFLRWAEPQILEGTESVVLNPAHSHNEIRYFMSSGIGEFFMMENRQRTDWDAAIPGHGLLIFHIDMNHSGWNNNTLNCNPSRQGFDLEEADGLGNPGEAYINAGDPFPGTSANRFFTDESNPNALNWAGEPSRNPIRNIQEIGGVISFSFGDLHVDVPEGFSAEALGQDSIRLRWRLNAAADSVLIVSAGKNTITFPQNRQKYRVGDSAAGGEVIYKGLDTVFYHNALDAGKNYYYGIYAFEDSAYTYSEKSPAAAKTESPLFYSETFSDGLPAGWKILDRSGNGSWSNENPLNRSFASSSAGNGFMLIDSEYLGEGSLDAELITRSFNFALSRSVSLRFEHQLEIRSLTLARVLYTVNDGQTWYEAKRWTAATDGSETCELDLTAAVAGFRDVKFKFNFRGSNEKYWCIDDLSISSALNDGVSAAFHVTERSGSKPFTVEFMNTSVAQPGAIDTLVWELGEGDFVTEFEPVHCYTRSGLYSISLMVRSGELQSNYSRDNFIQVFNDAPVFCGPGDTLDVRMNSGTTVNLKQYFSDPNGDPLSFSWSGNSSKLTIGTLNDSLVQITPGVDFLGTERVRFIAEDNEGDTVSRLLDIWVSETAALPGLPASFALEQNYPNPFNPETHILYQLPEDAFVNLQIFDMRGRRVAVAINTRQSAGYYRYTFDAKILPGGIYFYRLKAGNFVQTRKMLLLK
ncbi:MAG: M6 family metalloprotease domain-containing protein [Candidatus Marinimicrobia bacterium]|nr:M6 family metalloprotease domain-containing protein [Candidatus Neomarinimicrobiota bacterium]